MSRSNKSLYNSIEVPKELDQLINNTIEEVRNEDRIKGKKNYRQYLIAGVIITCLFVIPLNSSQSFAQAIAEIPILSNLAELFTFKHYTLENETELTQVKIPSIAGLSDVSYQEYLNEVIKEKVEAKLIESQARAAEYKKAYIETGGTEESYANRKIQIVVDYEILSTHDKSVSFLVYSHESLAAAYATYDYYNIDLENNKILTLEDLYGPSYQQLITGAVKEQMQYQMENEVIAFFEELVIEEWLVRKDIDFYINENSNTVIVFNKYEVAAGVYGRLEYEID